METKVHYTLLGNWKHGLNNHKVRKIWGRIKTRCFNKNSNNYPKYGGRGITMYTPWKDDFVSFFDYVTALPSYPGEVNLGRGKITLDRINNEGGYKPGNLRWASESDQNKNRRKFNRKRNEQS